MDKAILALRGIRPVLAAVGALSLIQAAAMIGQALGLAKAVALLFQGGTIDEAIGPLAWFAAAWMVRHSAVWLQRLCAGRFAERTGESLRLRLTERLFERGPDYAAQAGSGRLVTLAMDGVDRFRAYLELTVIRTMDMGLVTISVLAAVYVLDIASGLILTVTMPVLIGFFILLGFAARRMADRQWLSFQVLARHFTDVLRGLATLKFLGRSRDYAAVVEQVSDRYRSATMRTLRVAFLSSFALDFFSTLSVAFVAVSLGLRLIGGGIGLEPALAVLLLAPEYFLPVRMLGADYHASLDGKEAWTAIRDVVADERGPEERVAAARISDSEARTSGSAARISGAGGTELRAAEKREEQAHSPAGPDTGQAWIQLSDVKVDGEAGLPRLDGLSSSIGSHIHKVGIVGMSGSGKTTLLHLLGGFLPPSSGHIRIDGLPLTEGTRQRWQQQLTYIPQHPYLFSATIADNVRFYEPDASDEQVMRALASAGLGDLIASLPDGIHERIGDGGRSLSGGQAQRIALARALVGNRPVWLLDEPTAHLDLETELELKETMLDMFAGRRVFLASHRLHWMKAMDWIWVLKDGRLVEAGTHEELLARQGVYRNMLEAASGKGG
ncbi:MAG: thiol reductant ABC exporter subunit CydD [Thermobacillus sp.]|uniref:thiol reductant ABC exporter subunit CydD n=1 Tax=Thermobacillus sp. TaxID=2108467 RepID=UPI000E3B2F21|nr:thiol reductant ABC exporter subunit CydD [Thermobacillus sp.]REK52365.1 MAG: thiol reductant ABC exporter subunit CydD [Thermobacillus sp.]